jgi:serine/threonine protein kinase
MILNNQGNVMDRSFFPMAPGDDEDPGHDTDTVPFGTLAAAIRGRTYEKGTNGKELQPGDRIHHYRILEPLGRGGVGSIFLAEHIYLKQQVALKTLRVPIADTGETAERFLREAQALALLNGPHVLKVQDASVFENIPYVVTERLHGHTLSDHLRSHGPLTINHAMDLLEQIGDVLIRQEKFGILHRDIKPHNVWLRDDGSFCLLDYGLVGFTETGASRDLGGDVSTNVDLVLGTPVYMAPEQAMGQRLVDHRADLFGLGVTTWEGLTGKLPRPRSNLKTVIREVIEVPIRSVREHRSDVTSEFARILDSMTAFDMEDRYQSARIFIEDLEAYRYGRRRPYGATRGSVFVGMPFHSSFDGLFTFLQDVCGEAKLAARRVDRVTNMNDIWHEIDKEIRMASIVIAVFSRERWHHAPNPNVLTEAAHARAIGRPLIILTTDPAEKLPFDWRNLPIIRYHNSKRGLISLRDELLPRLRQQTREDGKG